MNAFDIDRSAPASGAATIVVNAPVETVWRRLASVGEWPLWNQAISFVEVSSPIAVGTEFRWNAGRLPIRSRIELLTPLQSIGWIGEAPLIHARHIYRISKYGAGTKIVTEESFTGLVARLLPSWSARMISTSLEQGLAALRLACEDEKSVQQSSPDVRHKEFRA